MGRLERQQTADPIREDPRGPGAFQPMPLYLQVLVRGRNGERRRQSFFAAGKAHQQARKLQRPRKKTLDLSTPCASSQPNRFELCDLRVQRGQAAGYVG